MQFLLPKHEIELEFKWTHLGLWSDIPISYFFIGGGVLTLPFIFELSYWYLMTVVRMLKFWYDSLQQLHYWLPTFLHIVFVPSEKRAGICKWHKQELNGGVNNDKSSKITLTGVYLS